MCSWVCVLMGVCAHGVGAHGGLVLMGGVGLVLMGGWCSWGGCAHGEGCSWGGGAHAVLRAK